VDRAACECVGVVGSIAARRQHGPECLLPRGSAAAVRCAPCVPAAVPGCVASSGQLRTAAACLSCKHAAAVFASLGLSGCPPSGWAARGALQTPLGRPRRCAAALSSAILSWAGAGAGSARLIRLGQRAFCRRLLFLRCTQGVTQASSRALSSFGVSLATVQTFTLDSAIQSQRLRVPININTPVGVMAGGTF
jgi:hypothetical protein